MNRNEAKAIRIKGNRQATMEPGLPKNGRIKTERVNLGLVLLSRRALPGVALDNDDIAAWCGVTNAAISNITQKALRKLHARAQYDPVLLEMMRERR